MFVDGNSDVSTLVELARAYAAFLLTSHFADSICGKLGK
jgi:hypothetical protein